MKFYKNELMISHSNTKLNICQNVGPNELCIVSILSFFSVSLSVPLSLFTGKKKEEERRRRRRREETKNNKKKRIVPKIG
jgi:hypothetical protein